MLMKLRRAVLHPSLVLEKDPDDSDEASANEVEDVNVSVAQMIQRLKDGKGGDIGGTSSETFAKDVLEKLELQEDQECPICLTVDETNVVIPGCMHVWCVWFLWFLRECFPVKIAFCCSCKDCTLTFLKTCEEKREEGACPMCRLGPLKAGHRLFLCKP